MPRLFIAIELPDELKQKLGSLEKSFEFSQARWVKPENLHLTLKFLGQVKEEKVNSIASALKGLTADFSAFTLQTGEIGAFPSFKRARVIWIDIKSGREEAKKLACLIDDKLSLLGFEKEERDFQPHITLVRLKKPTPLFNLPVVNWSFSFLAKEVILFESVLKPTGPVYTPVGIFPLKITT